MLNKSPNFPEMEKRILEFWQKNKIFEKSLEQNRGKKEFIFYEGPPTANGKPGLHHVLARAFKDIILRFRTMKGEYVPRTAGWDTHGLPVELQVEKELGLKGKKDMENLVKGDKEKSIILFNQKCKESVFVYKKDWEDLTERMGFWLDMKDAYVTYEDEYIEKVWAVLKKINQKGMIYKDYKVVPYCPRCGTALSSHEVAQGYEKITEESVYVKFKIANKNNEYFLVWTTTPWTLPANVALAVGKDINYVKIRSGGEVFILAEDRLSIINQKYEIIEKLKGKDLLNLPYQPLYSFVKYKEKAHYVVPADFVTTEEGTGIVHTAVMYGEDDFNLGTALSLPKKHLVNLEGKFIKEAGKFAGMFVKKADPEIVEDLQARQLLYKTESVTHKYPFCWRCHTILLYYAKDSWYIAINKIREKLLENNQKINWIPKNVKLGRFGKWLEGAKDWAISRERFWGTPLPFFVCSKCNKLIVVGSKKELLECGANIRMHANDANKNIELHRPYVDQIKIKCPCGGEAKRVPEVLDVWFDSGAMPYASGEYERGRFPADYIVEAVDQTRGWFYTLLSISTLLDDGVSYKNVICLGHILDGKGKKMSKSLGNIVDPMMIMNKYGADALRFHLFTINQPGDRKRFKEEEVFEVIKKTFLIFWNCALFYQTYAEAEKYQAKGDSLEDPKNVLDEWILARLAQTQTQVAEKLLSYDIYYSAKSLAILIDDLSTWYIRRSRRRFSKNENIKDKNDGFATLHFVLLEICKLLAPFAPFISEEIYSLLRSEKMPKSVHLCSFAEKGKITLFANKSILAEMKKTRGLIKNALEERARAGIKIRQPLEKLTAPVKLASNFLSIIKDEVNVKSVALGKKFKLDTNISEKLKLEGLTRELVRTVQNLRKKAGLRFTDRIELNLLTKSKELTKILRSQKLLEVIKKETLAEKISTQKKENAEKVREEAEIDGEKMVFWIKKKS